MSVTTPHTDTARFLAIEVATLRAHTIPDFDVYLFNESESRYVLYRAKATAFDESDRRRLLENRVTQLYITAEDRSRLQAYIEDNLEQTVADPGLSTEEKAQVVYQAASGRVHEVLEDPEAPDNVRRSRRVVENVVNFVLADPAALGKLITMSSFDYEVYTHSVQVSTYGLALARHVGMTDLTELTELGIGMLLHDIGKGKIPKEILKKTEPLKPEDWNILKQHPRLGYEILRANGDMTERSLDVVLCHHERADSSGYPQGLDLNSIPLWARICCIADVFDALTTRRPYKDALPPYKALHIMCAEMNRHLDPGLLTQFVVLLGPRNVSAMKKTLDTVAEPTVR